MELAWDMGFSELEGDFRGAANLSLNSELHPAPSYRAPHVGLWYALCTRVPDSCDLEQLAARLCQK